MLTGKQRAALKREANGLSPVFQVGKGGVEKSLIEATENCLAARELVKLRVLETSPQTPREVADLLAGATKSQVVQVVGRSVVLFLKKDKESRFAQVL